MRLFVCAAAVVWSLSCVASAQAPLCQTSNQTSIDGVTTTIVTTSICTGVALPPPPPPPPPPPGGSTYTATDDASLSAIPWSSLQPGDTVQIAYSPTPYRVKVLLSQSGTATDRIRIVGQAGPAGERPILDGTNATTPAGMTYPFAATQDRGLLVITRRADQATDYKPKYISIEGLAVRGASQPSTFTDAAGAMRSYTANAACVFVERGEHITIDGNDVTGCGNGLFVASGATEALVSRDIKILNNQIHGNGNSGTNTHHNTYLEAIGCLYEGNTYGDLRTGSNGTGLKDRCAGTVIRDNTIAGGSIMVDLVDADGGAPLLTLEPSYHTTIVEGNYFAHAVSQAGIGVAPNDGGYIVHYGGDTSVQANYRKGTLYFRNNIGVIRVNRAHGWRTILLNFQTNDERGEYEGNVFTVEPYTVGASETNLKLMRVVGQLTVAGPDNSLSAGWAPWTDNGGTPTGTITGLEQIVTTP